MSADRWDRIVGVAVVAILVLTITGLALGIF